MVNDKHYDKIDNRYDIIAIVLLHFYMNRERYMVGGAINMLPFNPPLSEIDTNAIKKCPSHRKRPTYTNGDAVYYKQQVQIFDPNNNTGCLEEAAKKMELLSSLHKKSPRYKGLDAIIKNEEVIENKPRKRGTELVNAILVICSDCKIPKSFTKILESFGNFLNSQSLEYFIKQRDFTIEDLDNEIAFWTDLLKNPRVKEYIRISYDKIIFDVLKIYSKNETEINDITRQVLQLIMRIGVTNTWTILKLIWISFNGVADILDSVKLVVETFKGETFWDGDAETNNIIAHNITATTKKIYSDSKGFIKKMSKILEGFNRLIAAPKSTGDVSGNLTQKLSSLPPEQMDKPDEIKTPTYNPLHPTYDYDGGSRGRITKKNRISRTFKSTNLIKLASILRYRPNKNKTLSRIIKKISLFTRKSF